jgi:hypothetical protein
MRTHRRLSWRRCHPCPCPHLMDRDRVLTLQQGAHPCPQRLIQRLTHPDRSARRDHGPAYRGSIGPIVARGARLADAFRAHKKLVVATRVAFSPDGGDVLKTRTAANRGSPTPTPDYGEFRSELKLGNGRPSDHEAAARSSTATDRRATLSRASNSAPGCSGRRSHGARRSSTSPRGC